jgi:hypothetical protein
MMTTSGTTSVLRGDSQAADAQGRGLWVRVIITPMLSPELHRSLVAVADHHGVRLTPLTVLVATPQYEASRQVGRMAAQASAEGQAACPLYPRCAARAPQRDAARFWGSRDLRGAGGLAQRYALLRGGGP